MTLDGFLDTSTLIDALVPTHAAHHARAVRLMNKTSQGEITLHLSVTVVLEATFVLTRAYKVPRREVATELSSLLSMTNLVAPEKELWLHALELWARESPLSFADCYHLVLTEALGLSGIYTFDKKLGHNPGVERVEPE